MQESRNAFEKLVLMSECQLSVPLILSVSKDEQRQERSWFDRLTMSARGNIIRSASGHGYELRRVNGDANRQPACDLRHVRGVLAPRAALERYACRRLSPDGEMARVPSAVLTAASRPKRGSVGCS